MRYKAYLLAAGILGLVLLANGQKPSPKTDTVSAPRYQLIAARIGGSGDVRESVFLIDIYRGRIWKYQTGGEARLPEGKIAAYPEAFAPVGIGRPVVEVPGNGLKDAAEDDPIGH
jgi:hypothetical protein